MQADFWRRRWEKGEIGFHEGRPNALLVKHLPALALHRHARVFVPLCGKTRDVHWLVSQGCRVVGAELSQLAVEQLFAELQIHPLVTAEGPLRLYASEAVDILQGDVFEITRGTLGPVDAIYDRAALVAFPAPMRDRYAAALVELAGRAPQLLICFEYDQSAAAGPPFSVPADEVRRLYDWRYDITPLERAPVEGGLKGLPAFQTAWLLRPR